jgi:hypothetical protein
MNQNALIDALVPWHYVLSEGSNHGTDAVYNGEPPAWPIKAPFRKSQAGGRTIALHAIKECDSDARDRAQRVVETMWSDHPLLDHIKYSHVE